MTCVICKQGETQRGAVTVTLERGGSAIVFKAVPAEVCENCGEQYLDGETSGKLLKEAERAAAAGVEVEVRTFAAA